MMYGVIRRYELTDTEWESLARHLPSAVTVAVPVRTTAGVRNGIVWEVRPGAPWRDVPARYGSWKSI